MFDYSDLIGRIISKHSSRRSFAKLTKYSLNTISKKLNQKVPMTSEDVVEFSKLLDIAPEDIPKYFFKLKGE